MYESRPGIELYYFYDSYGNLTSIRYIKAGETTAYSYYVTTNAQGDVLGIYTAAGVQVAAYEYDAWGNCTVFDVTQDSAGNNVFTEVTYSDSQKFNMEFLNPFRYRGYYYDQDMGLYLTGTRYYDAGIGRFINADGSISDVGGNILGYNIFTYCFNNPVNMDDPTGQWPKWIGKAAAVVTVTAVVVAAVAITVSTFGAGSIAGVTAISAAVTIAARATEVAVLQAKKSKSSSKNAVGSNNLNSGGTSSGRGGNNTNNSIRQVGVGVTESLFDNGLKIIGITPFTKAGSIGVNYILDKQISKMFGETATLHSTLSATGGKVFPYLFAASAWCQTTISIFSDDPVERAEQRGYTLK